MSIRANARFHHQLGLIHTTVENAFLAAGMVFSTLAMLIIVWVTLMLLAR